MKLATCIEAVIDEQIVFSQLDENDSAVWSLLLAFGYLKVESIRLEIPGDVSVYRLKLTNYEVKKAFERMVSGWFGRGKVFGRFVSAMFAGNVREMNYYMNEVALNTFSYFEAGSRPSGRKEPERFYHGFVQGLIVDKAHLWLDAGAIFGEETALFQRINIAAPRSIIEKAMEQLYEAFR